jgi:hypothetical protein
MKASRVTPKASTIAPERRLKQGAAVECIGPPWYCLKTDLKKNRKKGRGAPPNLKYQTTKGRSITVSPAAPPPQNP